jgi:sugar lactone lactonase YvrE
MFPEVGLNVPGTRIHYANDVDIAKDGMVYFTDSTTLAAARFQSTGLYSTLETSHLSLYQVV